MLMNKKSLSIIMLIFIVLALSSVVYAHNYADKTSYYSADFKQHKWNSLENSYFYNDMMKTYDWSKYFDGDFKHGGCQMMNK